MYLESKRVITHQRQLPSSAFTCPFLWLNVCFVIASIVAFATVCRLLRRRVRLPFTSPAHETTIYIPAHSTNIDPPARNATIYLPANDPAPFAIVRLLRYRVTRPFTPRRTRLAFTSRCDATIHPLVRDATIHSGRRRRDASRTRRVRGRVLYGTRPV